MVKIKRKECDISYFSYTAIAEQYRIAEDKDNFKPSPTWLYRFDRWYAFKTTLYLYPINAELSKYLEDNDRELLVVPVPLDQSDPNCLHIWLIYQEAV